MAAPYMGRTRAFVPESIIDKRSGLRPSVQAVRDLIDTADPAWPNIADVLREFVAAGVDLDATSVPIAVKLGRERCGTEPLPEEDRQDRQITLASAAESIVYYIRRGDLIKIGSTTRPRKRFTALVPDEILAVEPGDSRHEDRRHHQFRHLRGSGDYFRDDPELREHIKAIREQYGDPDPAWRTAADAARSRRPWKLPLPSSTETLTAAQAEAELGIKEMTLRGWVHRGKLSRAGCDEARRHTFYREHLIFLRDASRRRTGTRTLTNWTAQLGAVTLTAENITMP